MDHRRRHGVLSFLADGDLLRAHFLKRTIVCRSLDTKAAIQEVPSGQCQLLYQGVISRATGNRWLCTTYFITLTRLHNDKQAWRWRHERLSDRIALINVVVPSHNLSFSSRAKAKESEDFLLLNANF